MTLVHRVLSTHPFASLEEHLARGGGKGLALARLAERDAIIDTIEASGLRGRGGAGFTTGTKWRTVVEHTAADVPMTVAINAAEGEPGTYKDRTLLQLNPFAVLEGAVIAALVVGAERIIVGIKRSFTAERARMEQAISEFRAAGLLGSIVVDVIDGPDEYLFGEETALLEVADGRPPFPRIAPPYRRGLEPDATGHAKDGSSSSASLELAETGGAGVAPPALVDNVETFANIGAIVARGPEWFRTDGTPESPGTIVCTVTGAVRHAGVGEVLLGTTVREAIAQIAGGPAAGVTIRAVLNGVSAAPIAARDLDTPLTYEAMAAIGSGLGTASLHVIAHTTDMTSVAAGVSRFLAVESCGQCTPCKQDGLSIADALARLCGAGGTAQDVEIVRHRLDTVADGARCALGRQHQGVVGAIVAEFADAIDARVGAIEAIPVTFVSELVSLVDGIATLDEARRTKQPDWSDDPTWSGASPADLAR